MTREPTPLHRRLWVVVAAALLPTAVLSGIALVVMHRRQQAEVAAATIETMRAMVSAVDGELDHTKAVAETLAASDALDDGSLRVFHEEARRVAALQPQWVSIVLSDLAGRQLLDLLSLQDFPFRRSFDRVLETARPAVGNLAVVGKTPGFPVSVPVVRESRIVYVLTVVVSPASMLEVIRRQRVPSDAVVSIFDARDNHVARSRLQSVGAVRPLEASARATDAQAAARRRGG